MEPTPAYIPQCYWFYRSLQLGLSYPASSRFSSPLTSKVDSSLKALALRSSEQESVKILELKIDSYVGNLERYIFTPSPFPSFISKKIESIEEVLKTLRERCKEEEENVDLGEIKQKANKVILEAEEKIAEVEEAVEAEKRDCSDDKDNNGFPVKPEEKKLLKNQ